MKSRKGTVAGYESGSFPGGYNLSEENMKSLTRLLFITAIAAFLCLNGCEDQGKERAAAGYYRGVASRAFRAYSALHPLRSSQLGITGSDSLLFTFSEDEIESSLKTLDNLLDYLEDIPAGGLNENQLDNLTLVDHWIKSEKFSLEKLRNYIHSPLIYCWMIRESLTSIPLRNTPPYQGEFHAYRTRISNIPDLIANARSNLRKSPRLHLRIARDWLSSILKWRDSLSRLVVERYGSGAAVVDEALQHTGEFRDYIEDKLQDGPHGRLILGFENLSDIFLFSEQLKFDPGRITSEAENKIRLLNNQRFTLEERINSGGIVRSDRSRGKPAPACTLPGDNCRLCLTEEINRIDSIFIVPQIKPLRPMKANRIILSFPLPPPSGLFKNPYLTIPPPVEAEVLMSQSPFNSGGLTVFASPEICRKGKISLYSLLEAAALVRGMARQAVEQNDTVRILLPSNLHHHGWRLNSEDIIIKHSGRDKFQLKLQSLRHKTLLLCRTIAVLRFHSGTYTMDEIDEFLIRKAGLSPAQARKESEIAVSFPLTALPGMAIIMNDRITRSLSGSRRYRLQKNDPYNEIMFKYYGLSLSLIHRKISS